MTRGMYVVIGNQKFKVIAEVSPITVGSDEVSFETTFTFLQKDAVRLVEAMTKYPPDIHGMKLYGLETPPPPEMYTIGIDHAQEGGDQTIELAGGEKARFGRNYTCQQPGCNNKRLLFQLYCDEHLTDENRIVT